MNFHDDGADDEDSTEEPLNPTVLPGWDINDVKKEYPSSTSKETEIYIYVLPFVHYFL